MYTSVFLSRKKCALRVLRACRLYILCAQQFFLFGKHIRTNTRDCRACRLHVFSARQFFLFRNIYSFKKETSVHINLTFFVHGSFSILKYTGLHTRVLRACRLHILCAQQSFLLWKNIRIYTRDCRACRLHVFYARQFFLFRNIYSFTKETAVHVNLTFFVHVSFSIKKYTHLKSSSCL